MQPSILLGFLTLPLNVLALVNKTEIEALIPPCSAGCFNSAVSVNPGLIDLPDISCHNITLQKPLSACIQRACSFEEQKIYSTVTKDICEGQSIPSKALAALLLAVILGPITLGFVAGRIYSKRKFSNAFGMDDYLILTAASFYSGTIPLYIFNTIIGYGHHYWHIDPLKIRILLVVFYIGEISYLSAMPVIKLSILFFYLRVFQLQGAWFRSVVWIMIVFVATAGLAFVITGIVQCLPIAGSFDKSVDAKCVDLNAVAYANAGVGIFQDIVILILPIPEILKLNMKPRKKILLLVMFSVGTIAVITSILRLPYLHDFATSLDQTWDNQTGSLWSLAEQSAAIICACMPAVRTLLAGYLPNIFKFDDPSRGENNDIPLADRGARKHKPLSLFHVTSDFSSQGTTIAAGSRADTDDLGWFRLKQDDAPLITLSEDRLGSPFRCNFHRECRASMLSTMESGRCTRCEYRPQAKSAEDTIEYIRR
ncbi:hypothetical protein VTL71DRAFT_13151 [Oculimacula yallundae]|uniref:Extracellular membrane protein CFEM domain-containing protein n=1 Tax=Oculimacula yallundae TaxID=86028 RepID=A0ABR4CRA2_9HELO